jgi:hypothetical protein
MYKVTESNGATTYQGGVPFALWFLILVPLGYGVGFFFEEEPWLLYTVVTLFGAVGFLIGAFGQRLVISEADRSITRISLFLGRRTGCETIRFEDVVGVVLKPRFVRHDDSDPLHQEGCALLIEWHGRDGEDIARLEDFNTEREAYDEARRLARIMSTRVRRWDQPGSMD